MTHSPSYRRILHKMGYYEYQRGLVYRHLDQGDGWTTHEDRCRRFILKALDFYRPSKVTVLGSGWLLDIPLQEMTDRVETICLVDIIHPPEVIAQTASLPKVRLIEEDITGGLIEEVWKKAGKKTFLNKLRSTCEIEIPEYKPAEEPGLVISLNILTQLETLPEKLLRKKSRAVETDLIRFRKTVQENHIRFLKKYNSVLISDTAEIFNVSGGKSYENSTLFAELPAGKSGEEWIWDFDLLGSDYNMKRSVLRVVAILL